MFLVVFWPSAPTNVFAESLDERRQPQLCTLGSKAVREEYFSPSFPLPSCTYTTNVSKFKDEDIFPHTEAPSSSSLGRCWHDVVSSTQHYWSAEGQKGLSTQNWWFIDQSSQKKFISQNESKECRFEIMNNHCSVNDVEIRRQKKSPSRES